MPPSAITGTPSSAATRAQSWIAVTCGTPTPATTRVVQMLPGPDPDLHRICPGVDQRLDGLAAVDDVPGNHLDRRCGP